MDAAMNRRAEKRICPPADAVLQFALWPTASDVLTRLPLSVLGPPLASAGAGHGFVLADITVQGLGLHVRAEPTVLECLAASPALFVYLKLRDYRYQPPNGVLSLFCRALPTHVARLQDCLTMGLRLIHQGRGSAHEKALELLDVRRFGLSELVAWIDALARDRQALSRKYEPGLNLDYLLDEPECVPTSVSEQGNQP
jgi:hypothetical protein